MKITNFLEKVQTDEVINSIRDSFYNTKSFLDESAEYNDSGLYLIVQHNNIEISVNTTLGTDDIDFTLNQNDISYNCKVPPSTEYSKLSTFYNIKEIEFNDTVLSTYMKYSDLKVLKKVYELYHKLMNNIKVYSFEEVSTENGCIGYSITLNGHKTFKGNRFGIVEDEQYASLIAREFNREFQNPTPNLDTGDIVKDIYGNEGVVVHIVTGTDFENHGMIEVYLTDKKYFEHYTWVQWPRFLTVTEQYN